MFKILIICVHLCPKRKFLYYPVIKEDVEKRDIFVRSLNFLIGGMHLTLVTTKCSI